MNPLLEGPLYIRVNWFFNKPGGLDTDNIFKAILDALKQIVYQDDGQIVQCLACKFDLNQARPEINNQNIPADTLDVYNDLANKLRIPYDSLLYIEVGPFQSNTANFGPIEDVTI